jgi:hypothetical protein
MQDAYTPDNRALGLVPGSRRRGPLLQLALADQLADRPGQVLMTGRAGTAVVLNAHAWHAGTASPGSRTRSGCRGRRRSVACRPSCSPFTTRSAPRRVPEVIVTRG